ncbi:MAG: methionyl-tRNA formyltransferase [Halobacteriovoraceae bacterium]|jgi:methionyl-tRNA formyltransferase|nr:methionyl-tRNA formyltransferase [Halobacteriovoraceae bacterium]
MSRLKTIFCGTPEFSVPVLETLKNNSDIELYAVVSMPDRPAGRGKKLTTPEVAQYAKDHNLKLIQTENINREEAFLKEAGDQGVDLIIVLAFAQFLGSKMLELPKHGCFNIHTSLLPKYRGAAPIQYALLNGDKQTGVSIQKMVKKMDAGDLVHSSQVKIGEDTTGGELYDLLKKEAAISIEPFIKSLIEGTITYTKQDETQVSLAPTLKKNDGFIDFKNQKVDVIFNQVRALKPWPGTFCFLNNKRLKVINIKKESSSLKAGELSIQFNTLLVGCLDGALRLTEVQLEGKKACTDTQLLNGLNNKNEEFQINPKGGLS